MSGCAGCCASPGCGQCCAAPVNVAARAVGAFYAGLVTVQLDRAAMAPPLVQALPPAVPAAPVPHAVGPAEHRPGLGSRAVRLLAIVLVLAYVTCVAIQPLPAEP